jgi:hypothetical protein
MMKNKVYLVVKIILLFWLTAGYPLVQLHSQNLIVESTTFNSGPKLFFSPGMVTSPGIPANPVLVTGSAMIDYKAVQYVHLAPGFGTDLATGNGLFHAYTGIQPPNCPTAIITGANVFCGSSVLSAASSVSGGGTIISYRWQFNGNNIQGATNVTYTASLSGEYTVTVSNSLYWTAISGIFLVVRYPVVVAGTISANQTINYGSIPAMLSGTAPTGGISPYSYQWQFSNDSITYVDVSGATNLEYQPGVLLSTTYYRMDQTSSGGCNSFTNVVKITIIPVVPSQLNLPNLSVANGQTTCYNATQIITVAGGGISFLVQSGGSATMIAGQKILYYPGTKVLYGGYMHGYIASGGPWCGTKEAAIVTVPNKVEEISPVAGKPFFSIYPNPTTGSFALEIKSLDETPDLQVEIYGLLGERMLSKNLQGQRKYEFSLAGKPNGVYFIRVVSGKFAGTGKIIKQ